MRKLTRLKTQLGPMGMEWIDVIKEGPEKKKTYRYHLDITKFYLYCEENGYEKLMGETIKRIRWEDLVRMSVYGRHIKRVIMIEPKNFEVRYNFTIGDRAVGLMEPNELNENTASKFIEIGYERKTKEHQMKRMYKKTDDVAFFNEAMIELKPIMEKKKTEYEKSLQSHFQGICKQLKLIG